MERELRLLRRPGRLTHSLESLGETDLAEEIAGIRRDLFDRYESLVRDAASDGDSSEEICVLAPPWKEG
jgi:hypothetical protein